MDERVLNCFIFLLLGHFLCLGSSLTKRASTVHMKEQYHSEKHVQHFTSPISTAQKDITTPVTTVPTITPTTPTTSTTPIINPNSNPDYSTTPPATMTPFSNPAATTSSSAPSSSGASWCVAAQSASQTSLQVALDYACGYGGADCSPIQAGGSCYNPNTLRDHASYAFNVYYQKNPVPNSCSFGATAVTTSTDPSTGTCQYPSISTTSSVLNTSSTGSTVIGAVPSTPSIPSMAAMFDTSPHFSLIIACLMLLQVTFNLWGGNYVQI